MNKQKYIVKILEYPSEKEITPGCIFSRARDYPLKFMFGHACEKIFQELEQKIIRDKFYSETHNWSI